MERIDIGTLMYVDGIECTKYSMVKDFHNMVYGPSSRLYQSIFRKLRNASREGA